MSELPLSLKRSWLSQLGPLTVVSAGIIASFAGASLLWLMVCILSGFI